MTWTGNAVCLDSDVEITFKVTTIGDAEDFLFPTEITPYKRKEVSLTHVQLKEPLLHYSLKRQPLQFSTRISWEHECTRSL